MPCGDVSDELAMEHLHRYAAAADFVQGKSVLDIASGEGYGSYILSQVAENVIGVDVDPKAVAHATVRYQNKNLAYKDGSCNSIPCEDASIDVVVSFETLEHISEHDAFMAEVKRVLKADGVLLLSTPNIDEYNALRDETNPYHVKELNRKEFVELLAKYFKTCHIAGQAGFFCSSLVFGDTDGESERNGSFFTVFSQNAKGKVLVASQPENPAYLIAVASDSDIGVPVSSFYEGNIKRNIISALEGGIVERDGWCLEKDNQLQALNERIKTLQASEQKLIQHGKDLQDKVATELQTELHPKNEQVAGLEAQLRQIALRQKKCWCSKLKEKLFKKR